MASCYLKLQRITDMNREELKNILPHREPMLLVDDVSLTEDGECIAHYTVRGDEFFLQGHFPGNPIVPGVILCEMAAQSSAVLLTVHRHQQCKISQKRKTRRHAGISLQSQPGKASLLFYYRRGHRCRTADHERGFFLCNRVKKGI